MDLWDLTKVLFRRWYVALPLLVLTASVAIFIGQAVKPDYSAAGHLQMIPPTAADSQANTGNRNPWVDLGVDALGQAAIVKVTNQSVVDQLVGEGLTDSFTISPVEAILAIEAVASTPQVATATVRRVMELIEEDVAAEQAPYRLPAGKAFTTQPLDDGSNVKVVTSKVKRGIAAAAGASLLLTIAGTLAVDALFRRRQRAALRRTDFFDEDPAVPMPPSTRNGYRDLDPPTLPPRRLSEPPSRPGPLLAEPPARPDAGRNGSTGTLAGLGMGEAPMGQMPAGNSDIVVEYGPVSGEQSAPAKEPSAYPTDVNSTIVLPLPNPSWSSTKDKSRPR